MSNSEIIKKYIVDNNINTISSLLPTEKQKYLLYCLIILDITVKYNQLIVVYSNASGYLWERMDAKGGTRRSWSNHNGSNEDGSFASINNALEIGIKEFLITL